MNSNGLLFGLFIIGCGALTFFKATGKDDHELVGIRSGALVEARAVKYLGIIVMSMGLFVLILSLLLPAPN